MKKKLLFSAFFVLGAAFAGCSDDEKPVDPVALAIPVLAEDAVTQVSVAVTWDAVENAVSYACTLDGGAETTVTQPSVRFDGLEPGRSYTVKVKAVAGQEQYLDSEFAQITLTTLPATQLAAPVLSAGNPAHRGVSRLVEGDHALLLVGDDLVLTLQTAHDTVDGGEELTVTGLSAVVTGLESGMPATVRVKAVSGQVQFLDSEFAELTVAAAMEQNPFTLSAAETGMNSISVSVSPKSKTRTYYCGYALKSDFDKYASTEEFIGSVRRKLSASALIAGVSFEEYLATQLVQGDHPFEFTGLKPETDYVVYAVGWYAPGDLLTTVLVSAPATTLPDASGEVTVTFENVASDGFDVVCTPDAAIEKYYVHVTKTSSLAMEVLMAGGLEAFKKEVMPTKGEYTGPQTIRKTGLAAGTSYSVCVLGISKSGSDFWIEKTQKTEKAE